jgi:hypothetical protein
MKGLARCFCSSTGWARRPTSPLRSWAISTGFRRITLECRGHGGSDRDRRRTLSIATFADDLLALDGPSGHREAPMLVAFPWVRPSRRRLRCLIRCAHSHCASRVPHGSIGRHRTTWQFLPSHRRFLEDHDGDRRRAGAAKQLMRRCVKALQSASPDNAASLLRAARPARSALDRNSCCHGWLSMGLVSRLPITTLCGCPCR